MTDYKASKRIVGTSAERTALNVDSPPATSWKELDRVTLTSAGDSIDTSTFTTKDNIMILEHKIPTGNARSKYRFNADSGSNYATRRSQNGGSDGTFTSESFLYQYHSGGTAEGFSVSEYNNISAQEKLGIAHVVENNSSGAGNAPNRDEYVHKWSNTSAQINRVEVFNDGTGDFNTGSEIVVLGYDNDEADSGTNFWQELANVTATSGTTISSGTFTAKKYLMFDLYFNASGSGGQPKLQVGNSSVDTGSNYATRRSSNGSEDTLTSQDVIYPYTGGQNTSWYVKGFIINKSDKEKLFIMQCNEQTTAGAGNVPTRAETVAKWTNTSNQINIMQFESHNSIAISNAKLTVWGAD